MVCLDAFIAHLMFRNVAISPNNHWIGRHGFVFGCLYPFCCFEMSPFRQTIVDSGGVVCLDAFAPCLLFQNVAFSLNSVDSGCAVSCLDGCTPFGVPICFHFVGQTLIRAARFRAWMFLLPFFLKCCIFAKQRWCGRRNFLLGCLYFHLMFRNVANSSNNVDSGGMFSWLMFRKKCNFVKFCLVILDVTISSNVDSNSASLRLGAFASIWCFEM